MSARQAFDILQVAYLGIGATDLPEWRRFASDFLGMQVLDAQGGRLAMRMDERTQRILIEPAERDGLAFFGLELRDEDALRAAERHLNKQGIATSSGTSAECDLRGVAGMRWCADPDGNRVELCYGPKIAAEPFRPGRPTGGFRTGAMGLGHVVMQTPKIEPMRRFYLEVLGFRLSDYLEKPFKASFMHVNARHHSLALLEFPEARFQHVMVEYNFLDDVGRLYDMALRESGRIMTTLGRHTNDHMLSFYSRTPGGFMIETGWAGRIISDMEAWQPVELSSPSIWGHERNYLPPAAQAHAKKIMGEIEKKGLLEPTEVNRSPAFSLGRIEK